jgi:hypothetical protein
MIFFAEAQTRRARCSRQLREQKSWPPAASALRCVTNIPQVSQRTIVALRGALVARPARARDGVISQRTKRITR